MGGKLITKWGLPEKRIPAEEYFLLEAEVRAKMRTWGLPAQNRMITIPAYRKKESFGDLDVLVERSEGLDLNKIIPEAFGFAEPHCNAGVYSFPYKGFQVDLITVAKDVFDVALAYFAWNDCGNLCGRIFHSLGLSYGHEGLYYIVREESVGLPTTNNSHVLKEVLLSTDPKRILQLVWLDWEHFQRGFDTLEEMFDWVCNSYYFNADMYKFEELNHINRTRNRKRASYAYFVKWLETHKQNYASLDRVPKIDYLPWIIKHFPFLQDELNQCKKDWDDTQIIRSRFNGDLVSEWTGIEDGVELGKVIKDYKEYITGDADKSTYRTYHLNHDAEYVKGQFLVWHNHHTRVTQ